MLKLYLLSVTVADEKGILDENSFRELVEPRLQCLHHLKGAFDKRDTSVVFHKPQQDVSKGWYAKGSVAVSIGKQRAEYLLKLYEDIVQLISLTLPDLTVAAQTQVLEFSDGKS